MQNILNLVMIFDKNITLQLSENHLENIGISADDL